MAEHWQRVTELFERLLASSDPLEAASAEPDPNIRHAALTLWSHHLRADQDEYLSSPVRFELTPAFNAGQMILDRFRIEKMLGRGGMGEVYLAWDNRVGDRVAIKTIAPLLATSSSLRRRFAAEVQNARRVTHPNVCRIHDLFEEGATVFFSMEYLQGELLSDLIAQGLPPASSRAMLYQMADGLHAAHTTGVVHSDLKPTNVIVIRPGKAKHLLRAVITDFGLSRTLDPELAIEPGLSVQAGTADYMAPELYDGDAPTVQSDIFAFGKIGQRMLPKEQIWRECTQDKPALRPRSLESVVRRLRNARTRRLWTRGLGIAGATVVFGAIRRAIPFEPLNLDLPYGTRIFVNAFRGDINVAYMAHLFRSLLIDAIARSPRIQPVPDEDLVRVRDRIETDLSVPIGGPLLRDLLTSLRASYWVEGYFKHTGGFYSLDIRLLNVIKPEPLASTSCLNFSSVTVLADAAAGWLRVTAGEPAPIREVFLNRAPLNVGASPPFKKYFGPDPDAPALAPRKQTGGAKTPDRCQDTVMPSDGLRVDPPCR